MGRIFAVTSGKGGVGKSTVAAGLAAATERCGNSVLLIDMDEGLRCLDWMLSLAGKVVFDLSDVFDGRDAMDAVYPVDGFSRFYLLPAPARKGRVDPELFGEFLRDAARNFDVVFLDFPAGIDLTFYRPVPDYAVFLTVCNPDPVSLRDAGVVTDRLREIGKEHIRLICNRFDIGYIRSGIYRNIDEMIDLAGSQLLGIVPEDKKLLIAGATGKPVRSGRAYRAFARIADRLFGKSVPLPRVKKI